MDLDAPIRARLPAAALATLADLRARPGLDVLLLGEVAWLRWEQDAGAITLRLLPVEGAALFERRGELWFPAGKLLPVAGVPDDRDPGWRHLSSVLFPARVEPLQETLLEWEAAPLRLVPADEPQPTTAVRATFAAVRAWCDAATSAEMAKLRAAWCGDEVLLVGPSPPVLPGARRYHGERILLPLGCGLAPALPTAALVEILGLRAGEIALLDHDGVEVVGEAALVPLTRAGLRRADALREEA